MLGFERSTRKLLYTHELEIHETRKRLTYWDARARNQQAETRRNRTEQETTRDAHDSLT